MLEDQTAEPLAAARLVDDDRVDLTLTMAPVGPRS
jgi:hypothetical protein